MSRQRDRIRGQLYRRCKEATLTSVIPERHRHNKDDLEGHLTALANLVGDGKGMQTWIVAATATQIVRRPTIVTQAIVFFDDVGRQYS